MCQSAGSKSKEPVPRGPKSIADPNSACRYRGLESDETVVAAQLEKLKTKLEGYERILSERKWLAGDVSLRNCLTTSPKLNADSILQDLTLADLFHLPYGVYLGDVSAHL